MPIIRSEYPASATELLALTKGNKDFRERLITTLVETAIWVNREGIVEKEYVLYSFYETFYNFFIESIIPEDFDYDIDAMNEVIDERSNELDLLANYGDQKIGERTILNTISGILESWCLTDSLFKADYATLINSTPYHYDVEFFD